VTVEDRTEAFGCLGLWGPNARTTLQSIADDPDALTDARFPFATVRDVKVAGVTVSAFRISYVGEQGFELHFDFDDGLALWDALHAKGVTPVGVETYANSRRLEKSLRLQNADLLTEYNLLEADLARPKVKSADFHGKEAYLAIRAREQQPATLCTLTMTDNVDAKGVARYPVGTCPILDARGGAVLVDAVGRRSYTTSIAFGPTLGRNVALGYLPREYCEVGRELFIEYFDEQYPVAVAAVGYRPLYDPQNLKPRS
jgi:glycine cleavage system aminomethyltransferase T